MCLANQCSIRPPHLFYTAHLLLLLLLCGEMRASELFKLIQTAKKPLPVGGTLRIAIVGSGYAGIACAYYGCNYAQTVKVFGLEDSPGEQRSSSASTISAGLLHPLTPRGKVMYRGEEAFSETLKLLSQVQEHSTDEVFVRYPYGDIDSALETSAHGVQDSATAPLSDPSDGPSLNPNSAPYTPNTLNQLGSGPGSVSPSSTPSNKPGVPKTALRALLRPLFRESDLLNWRKASEGNRKWVGLLTETEVDRFYRRDSHNNPSTAIVGEDSSAKIAPATGTSTNIDSDSRSNRGESGDSNVTGQLSDTRRDPSDVAGESGTEEKIVKATNTKSERDASEGRGTDGDDSADDTSAVAATLLGVAVIKNAIVVNSTAYLKGLWSLIRSQNSNPGPEEGGAGAAEEGGGDHVGGRTHEETTTSCVPCDKSVPYKRSVTYEQRSIAMDDVARLSEEFDLVILASGAGTQKMWSEEDILPFAYVRGQNVELALDDRAGSAPRGAEGAAGLRPRGIEAESEGVRGVGEEGEKEGEEKDGEDEEERGLESVLLAGEYIVPRKHYLSSAGSEASVACGEGDIDSSSGRLIPHSSVSSGSSKRAYRKTLLIGGTHEHAVTMSELEAPPDMERASQLLMGKMLSMYPALSEEGWKPSKCYAGIRVVPPRSHLGRLPVAGRHLQHDNVWLIGGLGSRGLLYHSLLAQLVLQEATRKKEGERADDRTKEEGVGREGGVKALVREQRGGRGRNRRGAPREA